jgi:hypothetical protein
MAQVRQVRRDAPGEGVGPVAGEAGRRLKTRRFALEASGYAGRLRGPGRRSGGREGGASVQLRFELGDPQAPRGHAIVYARSSGPTGPVLATYCLVLPIAFTLGKYLPPMLAAQMPLEGLQEAGAPAAVPIPPMLEEVPDLAGLRQAAERRADDLCDMGVVAVADDGQRMRFAAEAAAAYGQLYVEYAGRWPATATGAGASGPTELDVDEVLAEAVAGLSERDRLAELARGLGTLRYAAEGNDKRLLEQTERGLRRVAAGLPEKYRADQLVAAALLPDARGTQLAQLYLQRAYKLVDEDYAAIPPIEAQIRELRDQLG